METLPRRLDGWIYMMLTFRNMNDDTHLRSVCSSSWFEQWCTFTYFVQIIHCELIFDDWMYMTLTLRNTNDDTQCGLHATRLGSVSVLHLHILCRLLAVN